MKRNTILAIMITFCFTVSMFMVIPIRSSISPYDPMLDYNHDGKVSLQDLQLRANSYGTAGDPTVPVNVTNWPETYSLQAIYGVNVSHWVGPPNMPSFVEIPSGSAPLFKVEGFSRMTVSINVENMSEGDYNMVIFLSSVNWFTNSSSSNPSGHLQDGNMENYYNATIVSSNPPQISQARAMTIETKGPYAGFEFEVGLVGATSTEWAVLDFFVYLRNE